MASCIAFPWRFLNLPLPPRVTKQSFFTFLSNYIYMPLLLFCPPPQLTTFTLSNSTMPTTADLFSTNIPSDDSDSDSPEKCRKRRRRRIEMRRMRTVSGQLSLSRHFQPPLTPRQTLPQSPTFLSSTCKKYLMEQQTLPKLHSPNMELVTPPSMVENPMPAYGCISIQGLSETMDDAWFVKEHLCRPDLFGGKPLHFFAVYDGHGGSHVSTLCKKMMHRIMVEELSLLYISKTTASGDIRRFSLGQAQQNQQHEEVDEEEWEDLIRVGIERSFKRMDQVALSTCVCEESGNMCRCQEMMERAFVRLTAVLALLTPHHIVVANCGDSRAVLCRDGRAIPLSLDHKELKYLLAKNWLQPERPDELQRIRAAGGKIFYQNGVRDYGILSLGDNLLKSVITSKPEISITEREAEDECLILASDGIWDVVSDELACEIATACLKEGSPATATSPTIRHWGPQLMFPSKPEFAATILCRLALGRGSHHNITLIVVDLRSPKGNQIRK